MANKTNAKSDAELGFIDDVPVKKADGTETTLGAIDPTPVADTPAKQNGKAKNGKAGAKLSPKAKQSAKENAALEGTRNKGKAKLDDTKKTQSDAGKLSRARTQADTTLGKVDRALARLTDPASAEYKGQVETATLALQGYVKDAEWAVIVGATDKLKGLLSGVNAEVKRVKETKVAEREAKKQAQAEAKAEREALRLKKLGLTGDPEKDAELTRQYEQVIPAARALSITPAPVSDLGLGFLSYEGVDLRQTGLVLADGLAPIVWNNVLGGLLGLADVNQFAIGDALVYGSVHYPENLYENVRKSYNLGQSTVKNYKYVAGTWPVDERVVGVGFAFHREAASLYRKNAAAARNLLEQVKTEGRTLAWLVEQVKVATGADVAPTPVQKRVSAVDALIQATTEQRAADLAALGNNPKAVAKAEHDELVALVEYANRNDLVESEAVVRNVARLQARVLELEAENKSLRARLSNYEGQTFLRHDANVRIVEAEDADQEPSADSDPYLSGRGPSAEDLAGGGDNPLGYIIDDED